MHQLIRIVLRHWKPVVGLNVVIMMFSIVGILNVKKTWTARAQLILPSATTDLNANLGTLGNVTGGEGLIFTQQVDTRAILSKILLSDTTLRNALVADPERVEYSNVRAFRELFNVSPAETSTTISLDVEAATPDVAEKRLKNLIDSFQKQLTVLRQDDVKERSRLIRQELNQAEAELKAAEQRLISFQDETNLASGETQIAELVKTINTLNTTQAQLESRLLASQATVSSLSAQMGQSPDRALQSLRVQANSVYQANRARLAEIEVELSEARARRTENHPRVATLLKERAAILNQSTALEAPLSEVSPLGLDNVLNNNPIADLSKQLVGAQAEVATLQSQADELQRQIDGFNAELTRISKAQATFRELQRQYNIAEGIYNGLVAQLNATKNNSFSSYPNVQILDAPKVDAKPSGPGKRVVAMGAMLSSLLGSAAIILYREGQNPLLLTDDLKDLGIPVLGRIPYLPSHVAIYPSLQGLQPHASGNGNSIGNGNGNGTGKHQPPLPSINSALALNNEFQRLASALSRQSVPKRRVLISSPIPKEGKTTVALGLASALSNLGFRVLLVDADRLNQTLTAQLGQDVTPRNSLPSLPVSVASRLEFLPLQVTNSALGEFLAQGKFETILTTLQNERLYDYILVDMPSIQSSSELSLMIAAIPNLLLVLWPGKSLRKPFVDSLERLQLGNTTIQGLVMNGVDQPSHNHPTNASDLQAEDVALPL